MFKKLAFIALLLNACGTQTSAPPRIVKFDDVFADYMPIENDCDWQEVDVAVFKQKHQRVSFRYRDCERENKILEWKTSNTRLGTQISALVKTEISRTLPSGEVEVMQTNSAVTHFLIAKQGPLTAEDYLDFYAKKSPLRQDLKCSFIQDNIYSWRYRPISNCKLVDQIRFIVKEGIVVRFSDIDVAGDIIDLSSITYTNHG